MTGESMPNRIDCGIEADFEELVASMKASESSESVGYDISRWVKGDGNHDYCL